MVGVRPSGCYLRESLSPPWTSVFSLTEPVGRETEPGADTAGGGRDGPMLPPDFDPRVCVGVTGCDSTVGIFPCFSNRCFRKNIQHPDSLVLYRPRNLIQEDLTLKVFPSVKSHKHWLLVLLRVISTFFFGCTTRSLWGLSSLIRN